MDATRMENIRLSFGLRLKYYLLLMKKIFTLLFVVVCLVSAPRVKAEVSLDLFYDSLADDGDWFEADDYGYCWQPHDVSANWSPYTDGYWTYTDAGWTWVSYESHGWATYHYGRWTKLQERGWVWVPGYEWGPAWVSWRSNDDYVGWAPLPARSTLRVGFSIGSEVDADFDIGPSYYSFAPCQRFGSPSLSEVIVDRSENVTIINETTNITNITYVDNQVYNGGPDYDRINRRSERPIERLRLDRITAVDGNRDYRFNRPQNGRLAVVAPAVVPVEQNLRPRAIKASLGRVQRDNGWAGVRDQKLADRTRGKMREDAKGRSRGPENQQESVAQAMRQEARSKQVASLPPQQANIRGNRRPAADRPDNNATPLTANDAQNKPRKNRDQAGNQKGRAQNRENMVPGAPAQPNVPKPDGKNRRTKEEIALQRDGAGRGQANPEAAAQRQARQNADGDLERARAQRQQQQAQRERNQASAQANAAREEQQTTARQQAGRKANQEQAASRQQEAAVRQQAVRRQEEAASRQQENAVRQQANRRNEQAAARNQEQAAARQREQAANRNQEQAAARREQAQASARNQEQAQARREQAQAARANAERQQAMQERQQQMRRQPAEAPQQRREQQVQERSQGQPRPQAQQGRGRQRELTPEEIEALKKAKREGRAI